MRIPSKYPRRASETKLSTVKGASAGASRMRNSPRSVSTRTGHRRALGGRGARVVLGGLSLVGPPRKSRRVGVKALDERATRQPGDQDRGMPISGLHDLRAPPDPSRAPRPRPEPRSRRRAPGSRRTARPRPGSPAARRDSRAGRGRRRRPPGPRDPDRPAPRPPEPDCARPPRACGGPPEASAGRRARGPQPAVPAENPLRPAVETPAPPPRCLAGTDRSRRSPRPRGLCDFSESPAIAATSATC